jgi:hypothetical protein
MASTPEFTNTMITASAIDHQADYVYHTLRDNLGYTEIEIFDAAQEWEFAAALSPSFNGVDHLGYFVH